MRIFKSSFIVMFTMILLSYTLQTNAMKRKRTEANSDTKVTEPYSGMEGHLIFEGKEIQFQVENVSVSDVKFPHKVSYPKTKFCANNIKLFLKQKKYSSPALPPNTYGKITKIEYKDEDQKPPFEVGEKKRCRYRPDPYGRLYVCTLEKFDQHKGTWSINWADHDENDRHNHPESDFEDVKKDVGKKKQYSRNNHIYQWLVYGSKQTNLKTNHSMEKEKISKLKTTILSSRNTRSSLSNSENKDTISGFSNRHEFVRNKKLTNSEDKNTILGFSTASKLLKQNTKLTLEEMSNLPELRVGKTGDLIPNQKVDSKFFKIIQIEENSIENPTRIFVWVSYPQETDQDEYLTIEIFGQLQKKTKYCYVVLNQNSLNYTKSGEKISDGGKIIINKISYF